MIGSTNDPRTCPGCGRAALEPREPMRCDVCVEIGRECTDPMRCTHCKQSYCTPVADALRAGAEGLAIARAARKSLRGKGSLD